MRFKRGRTKTLRRSGSTSGVSRLTGMGNANASTDALQDHIGLVQSPDRAH